MLKRTLKSSIHLISFSRKTVWKNLKESNYLKKIDSQYIFLFLQRRSKIQMVDWYGFDYTIFKIIIMIFILKVSECVIWCTLQWDSLLMKINLTQKVTWVEVTKFIKEALTDVLIFLQQGYLSFLNEVNKFLNITAKESN